MHGEQNIKMSHKCRLYKGIFLCILGLCNNAFNFSDHQSIEQYLLVSKEVNLDSRGIN